MTPEELSNIFAIVGRHFARHKVFYPVWGFWSYVCLMCVGIPVVGSTPLPLFAEWMIVLASIMLLPAITTTNAAVVGIRKRRSVKTKIDKAAARLAELEEQNKKLEAELELDTSNHEVVH